LKDPRDIAAGLPGPRDLALFLDVDGTLIGPLHGDRERGIATDRIELLRGLSALTGGAVAVLSGRALESVDDILAPLTLPTAGLQGADRRYPDGKRVMPVLTADDRRLFETLAEKVEAGFPTVFIEWKPGGMAFVHDEDRALADGLIALARSVVGKRFTVMDGRVAIDVVPPGTDKGHALAAFMERQPCVGRVPVHVGDDVPDEPAFRAAEAAGGFGITVGRTVAGVTRRVGDHEDVWAILEAYATRHG
jgi:trehalose 6-phosphate phosphatase